MHRPGPALLTGALALAAAGALAGPGDASAVPQERSVHRPAIALSVPKQDTWQTYDGEVYPETQPQLIAGDRPFELRSTRVSYDRRIVTRWKQGSRWVRLPAGTMRDFSGLPHFFEMVLRDGSDKVVKRFTQTACLNGAGIRVRPDAPARSPYPDGCGYNAYALGSVMGIQAGWVTQMWNDTGSLRLAPGSYTLSTRIDVEYQRLFHLPAGTSSATTTIHVVRGDEGDEGDGDGDGDYATSGRQIVRSTTLQPAARPATHAHGRTNGPRPDLRSLPAWGIEVAPGGDHLNFSATVWNAGRSPMVVDGFKHKHKALMEAYQYFFDFAGNQIGYQKIGHMEWDPRPSHHHWHFEDFARYRLMNADHTLARRSHKEAFCLANTDAIDYTIPGAAWHPENTDLSTACGDLSSPAVREELSVGSGDTYSQDRAGQSFNLEGLPNGVYYISVEANPDRRIIESNTHNDTSRRWVRLGGTPGHRTVEVHQIGRIVEPPLDEGGFTTPGPVPEQRLHGTGSGQRMTRPTINAR